MQTFGRIAPVHTGDAAGGADLDGGQSPTTTAPPTADGPAGAPAGGRAISPSYATVGIPAAYRELVKWAANDRATRELIIADGVDHGQRCLGKLCASAILAFGVQAKADGTGYERDDSAARLILRTAHDATIREWAEAFRSQQMQLATQETTGAIALLLAQQQRSSVEQLAQQLQQKNEDLDKERAKLQQ